MMKPILIVNPELGWDSVSCVLNLLEMTEDEYEKVKEICERNNFIMIDWKTLQSAKSFIADFQ